jgi:hypothetical protein
MLRCCARGLAARPPPRLAPTRTATHTAAPPSTAAPLKPITTIKKHIVIEHRRVRHAVPNARLRDSPSSPPPASTASDDAPALASFSAVGLDTALATAVDRVLGSAVRPTEIQQRVRPAKALLSRDGLMRACTTCTQSLPLVLAGSSCIVSAETGSGKTLCA